MMTMLISGQGFKMQNAPSKNRMKKQRKIKMRPRFETLLIKASLGRMEMKQGKSNFHFARKREFFPGCVPSELPNSTN